MGNVVIENSAAPKRNTARLRDGPRKAGERIRTADIHVGNVTLYH